MKYKLKTNGKTYKVFKKFLFWWTSELPEYKTVNECREAIFRVWGDSPDPITIERV